MKILIILLALFAYSRAYAQVPVITDFSPASGPVGTTLTITGSNFGSSTSDLVVFIGKAKARVTSANNTTLQVVVPTGAQSVGLVTVTRLSTALTGNSLHISGPRFLITTTTTPTASSYSRTTRATLASARQTAAGDFDADGLTDIAVGSGSTNLMVLNAKADSCTSPQYLIPKEGTNPRLISDDFNNDGRLDFAFVTGPTSPPRVGVVLQQANGTTASPVYFDIPDAGTYLESGDFNNDGRRDIVVSTYPAPAGFTVLVNSGTSSIFTSARPQFATADNGLEMEITDFDLDGFDDLIFSCFGGNSISVYRGTGNASLFGARTDFSTSFFNDRPWTMVLADFNSDGKDDFALSHYYQDQVHIYLNNSVGSTPVFSFSSSLSFYSGCNPFGLEVGNFNNDALPDLVVGGWQETSLGSPSIVSILLNDGASFLTSTRIELPSTSNLFELTAVDINEDGITDIVAGQRQASIIEYFVYGPYTPPSATGQSFVEDAPVTSSGCAATTVQVPITVNCPFNSGNQFFLELSDASGSFSSPTNLQVLTATTATQLSGTVSTGLPAGTYKVRVRSTSPAYIENIVGSDITIVSSVLAPAAPAGHDADDFFCTAKTSSAVISVVGGAATATSYQWRIRNSASVVSLQYQPATADTSKVTLQLPGTLAETFQLEVRSVNSCGTSAWISQDITLLPTQAVDLFLPADTAFCTVTPFTFDLARSGDVGANVSTSYSWSGPGITTASSSAQTIANAGTYAASYSRYTRSATPGIGDVECLLGQETMVVTVAQPSASQPNLTGVQLCVAADGTVTVNNPIVGQTYELLATADVSATALEGPVLSTTTLPIVFLIPQASLTQLNTTFYIRTTGYSGSLTCPVLATDDATITLDPIEASFSATGYPDPIEIATPIAFTNLSNPLASTYLWDFGDGATSTETNPTHAYTQLGQFTVTLRATSNNSSCTDTYELTPLVIEETVDLFIPNVFTPNGDGINEYFYPTVSSVARYEFFVYDRAGALVHKSTQVTPGWNGQKDTGGGDCQAGVYAFSMKIYLISGRVIERTGTLTLLR